MGSDASGRVCFRATGAVDYRRCSGNPCGPDVPAPLAGEQPECQFVRLPQVPTGGEKADEFVEHGTGDGVVGYMLRLLNVGASHASWRRGRWQAVRVSVSFAGAVQSHVITPGGVGCRVVRQPV